ncbi:transcriptional regulator, TetR family [Aeromicrobium marinum DSM 15272]|uniref:Transcriptional regulator, TetR family n=1 Tax=Aeromicrobium marinum DSM 15272 TaxID=585531 RepID=E2SFY7_9ACTN|nr:TetR/AcrR family transcriptional regulator [Aeromicrobium marinum]EFQ81934.1 transcriptional regulator, TetR family [Aeromicrobium marinum DSM 15272]
MVAPTPPVRKAPQQERSRLMVEKILTAGREVLLRDGYDAASTNKVAKQAGISPGSLYQYFADKDAVVDAVVAKYADELSDRVAASLTDQLGGPDDSLIHATLHALLDALEENEAFLRVFVDELPRTRNHERLAGVEQRVSDLMAAYLAARRGDVRDVPPSRAAWIVVRAIEQLTVRYVLDRPPMSRDELVAEVDAMVTAYLQS